MKILRVILLNFLVIQLSSAEETSPEVTFEKLKFQCENYSFETPHPEKVSEAKAWMKEIEMKILDENKNVMMTAGFGPNRGAFGPAGGSWKFWRWTDKIHVYSDLYNKEKKAEKYPYYMVQVLTEDEAYVLKYEEEGKDFQMTACKAQ